MREKANQLALRVSLLYALVGGGWILGSDWVLKLFLPDPSAITRMQTFKGWAFVGVTAVLLYVALRTQMRRWEAEVTERQRVERALRDSQERFRLLFDKTNDGMLLAYADGRIISANPELCRVLGRSEEELRQIGRAAVLDESDAQVQQIVAQRERTGQFKGEITCRRKDGSKFPAEISSTQFMDSHGVAMLSVVLRDITERKRAEETIGQERQLLRALIDLLPDAIYVKDKDGRFLVANEALAGFFGRNAPAQMLGLSDVDFYPADLAARFRAAELKVMAGEPLVGHVEMVEFPGGSRRTLMTTKVALRDHHGQVRGLVGLGRDITELKLAEARLQEERLRFQQLFENSPVATWYEDLTDVEQWMQQLRAQGVTDLRAWLGARPDQTRHALGMVRVLDINRAAVVQTAAANKEQLRVSLPRLFEEQTYALFVAELDAIWRGLESFEYESCGRRLDGRPFSAIVRFDIPRREGAPDFSRVVLTSTEITERKRAEEALRASEQNYRTLVESASDGIFIADARGHCREVNSQVCQMLGYGRAELLTLSLNDVVATAETQRIVPAPADLPEGRVMHSEWQFRRKDGTLFPGEVSQSILPDGRWLGIVRDITERVQAAETKQQLETQLRQAQKMEAIGTLAGGIAHDFNNILGTIVGNVELARMDLPPGHRVLESLSQIEKSGLRAKNLVQQILVFSRQQKAARCVIQLRPVLEESIKFLRATIPAGVDLVASFSSGVPNVLADPTQIHQILLNLCTNSWHAMQGQPGRVQIDLSAITVDGELEPAYAGLPPGRYARIQVTDTGEGMDAATLERIFEPFFTTKPPGRGTGLGLSVVDGIVRNHDGIVTVSSQRGQGTTFQVLLPTVAAELAPLVVGRSGLPCGNGEHVLYVDDEEPLIVVARRTLERLGYRVTAFNVAAAALAAVRADPGQFQLAITDFNMPGMSGLELAAELLRIRADLPVVLSSGSIDDELKQNAARAGVQHVLQKPHTLEDLSKLVHRLACAPSVSPEA